MDKHTQNNDRSLLKTLKEIKLTYLINESRMWFLNSKHSIKLD